MKKPPKAANSNGRTMLNGHKLLFKFRNDAEPLKNRTISRSQPSEATNEATTDTSTISFQRIET